MAPKYLMELLRERKSPYWDYALLLIISYLPHQIQQEKHLLQELSVSVDQLYGTTYLSISGPQQTIIPSKENLKNPTYLI